MFVTALYAVLSQETGQLTYANAGHNLPLVFRSSSGELEMLAKGGMALGVVEGSHAEEHSITLEQGDCVVFYTDGVTEAMTYDHQAYGDERLQQTIVSASIETAQSLLDTIRESVDAFTGNIPPSDDLTLMVLRRSG
jgi:sigma-B regulation protein RsbU (phosphoserine phosphatase)